MASSSSALSAVLAIEKAGAKVSIPPPPEWLPEIDTSRIHDAWYAIPHPVRYFMSGNVGNVCFYYCERYMAHFLLNHIQHLPDFILTHKDSVSFFLGYLIHIPAQHYSHALLVYGLESINTAAKYKRTLAGMYATLMTAAVGSTLLNAVFLNIGVNKTAAFFLTLSMFAVVNYFVIGYIVEKSSREAAVAATSSAVSAVNGNKKGKLSQLERFKKTRAKESPKVTKKTLGNRRGFLVRGGAVPTNASSSSMEGGGLTTTTTATTRRDWVRSTGGRPVTLSTTAQPFLDSFAIDIEL